MIINQKASNQNSTSISDQSKNGMGREHTLSFLQNTDQCRQWNYNDAASLNMLRDIIINKRMIKLEVNHDQHLLHTKLTFPTPEHTQPSPQLPAQIINNSESTVLSSSLTSKDKQAERINNIQATEKKVKRGIEEMIEQYKSEAEKMMLNHGYDPEKEAEIKQHLAKLQKQKEERQIKFKKDLDRLELKKRALEQIDNKRPEDIIERRKSIEKRIQLIHQRERRRQEEEARFSQFYQQYKERKPKYKQIEQQFREKEQKQKEEKIRRVKVKVEQTYKPMDLEKLSQFQQNYIHSRYEAEKQRLQNQLYDKKQQETNFLKLNQLYRGQGHSVLLEELRDKNQKNKEKQEKYNRIRDYSLRVKEQYRPRVRSSIGEQQEDSEANSAKMPQTQRGRRVVRDRYLKGEYQGKVVQYEKVPLSFSQQVNKGLQYLQFLRGLPKKPKNQEISAVEQPTPKKTTPVYRVQRQQNPLYRGRRYKSIDFDHISDGDSVKRTIDVMRHRKDELTMQQKVLRHRNFRNREEWQQGQKEFNSLLIGSIEQKLRILNKL